MADIKTRPAMDRPKTLNRDFVPKEAGSIRLQGLKLLLWPALIAQSLAKSPGQFSGISRTATLLVLTPYLRVGCGCLRPLWMEIALLSRENREQSLRVCFRCYWNGMIWRTFETACAWMKTPSSCYSTRKGTPTLKGTEMWSTMGHIHLNKKRINRNERN